MLKTPIHSKNNTPTMVSEFISRFSSHCKMVAITTVLVAGVAGITSMVLEQLTPRYASEAEILVNGPKYQLTFDPKFKTVGNLNTSESGAIISRAEEYKAIVLGPEVQNMALETLRAQSSPSQVSNDIFQTIKITTKGPSGSLIKVEATANTPEKSQQIANIYTGSAISRINAIYGQSREEFSNLERQLTDARAAYEVAEAEATVFTRQNRIDQLSREINQKQAFRDKLNALSKEQVGALADRLINYQAAITEIDRLRRDTRALRDQVEFASQSPTGLTAGAIALMGLHTRLLALGGPTLGRAPAEESRIAIDKDGKATITSSGNSAASNGGLNTPVQLIFNADSLIRGDDERRRILSDVDALSRSIEKRRTDFQSAIDDLTDQINQGEGVPLGDLSGKTKIDQTANQLLMEIHALQADLREESFRSDTLNQRVESTKTAWNTLAAKVAEATITKESNSGAAIVAAKAALGEKVWPPSPQRMVLLGSLAGFLLGLLILTIREIWSTSMPAWRSSPASHG